MHERPGAADSMDGLRRSRGRFRMRFIRSSLTKRCCCLRATACALQRATVRLRAFNRFLNCCRPTEVFKRRCFELCGRPCFWHLSLQAFVHLSLQLLWQLTLDQRLHHCNTVERRRRATANETAQHNNTSTWPTVAMSTVMIEPTSMIDSISITGKIRPKGCSPRVVLCRPR